MREIKFRGQSDGTVPERGTWAYGYLLPRGLGKSIYSEIPGGFQEVPVIPETVGQYTGIKDSTGKEVYEGDIVVVGKDTGNKYDRYIMTFNDDSHSYMAKQQGTLGSYIGSGYWNDKLVVIGNRWDNPELLGGAHDEH